MPANLENSAVAIGLEMVSFHSNPKEGQCERMVKPPQIALISQASKVMLKILQARLQKYMNWELPGVQTGFRKDRGAREQIANIRWIIEKAREFQKNIYFSSLTMLKLLPSKVHLVKAMVFPVVMYESESQTIKKAEHSNCGVEEDSWESLGLQGDQTRQFQRKSTLKISWKDWCWSWNSNTLATWFEELTHW